MLRWQLSNTLDVGFCLPALADALRVALDPYIFNSGQGSQGPVNRPCWPPAVASAAMAGDTPPKNAFIERLWRTVKREHIYLNHADDGHYLHQQLQTYFAYYNYHRLHQSLCGQTLPQFFVQAIDFKNNNV